MKTIVPFKTVLFGAVTLLIIVPPVCYSFMAVAFYVLLHRITPITVMLIPFCIGLWFFGKLVINRPHGVRISADTLENLCDHMEDVLQNSFEIPIADIHNVIFKKKGIPYGNRHEIINKNVLILTISAYEYKYIDLTYYSKRQTAKIMRLLEERIEHAHCPP